MDVNFDPRNQSEAVQLLTTLCFESSLNWENIREADLPPTPEWTRVTNRSSQKVVLHLKSLTRSLSKYDDFFAKKSVDGE